MTLDRYLKDVRTFLPADQADDIVNELSENLRAQFEDRESELGRALTQVEQEAILNAHGKPILVAARYRPEQAGGLTFGRQLIGPALFPSYVQVLTINVAITVFVVLVAAILAASGQPFLASASGVALAILIQFGVVTLIFVAAERAISGKGTWPEDVARSLPGEMQRSFSDRISEQLIGKNLDTTVPRRTSVFDFAVSALTVGWLLVVRPPNVTEVLRSGPGWESLLRPGPRGHGDRVDPADRQLCSPAVGGLPVFRAQRHRSRPDRDLCAVVEHGELDRPYGPWCASETRASWRTRSTRGWACPWPSPWSSPRGCCCSKSAGSPSGGGHGRGPVSSSAR